jgi:hypothetical protein
MSTNLEVGAKPFEFVNLLRGVQTRPGSNRRPPARHARKENASADFEAEASGRRTSQVKPGSSHFKTRPAARHLPRRGENVFGDAPIAAEIGGVQ